VNSVPTREPGPRIGIAVAVVLKYLPQPMKPCVNLEWAKAGPEIGGKACALISS
jgi:hypothetical protein